jgi:hypothetical protein
VSAEDAQRAFSNAVNPGEETLGLLDEYEDARWANTRRLVERDSFAEPLPIHATVRQTTSVSDPRSTPGRQSMWVVHTSIMSPTWAPIHPGRVHSLSRRLLSWRMFVI